MKNKVIIVGDNEKVIELERALSDGWTVKIVIAQNVSTSTSVATGGSSYRSSERNSSTVKGDIHYILEKEV